MSRRTAAPGGAVRTLPPAPCAAAPGPAGLVEVLTPAVWSALVQALKAAPVATASLFAAAAAAAAQPAPQAASPAPDCLGERQPLTVASQMPYALVALGGRQGYMVLDFGASVSSVTPQAFQGPSKPQALAGSVDQFDDFVFFGPWGRVRLQPQPQPALQGLRSADGVAQIAQAGVLGTDFLAQHVYTLDYRGGHLWRAARGQFCPDTALRAAGYRAVSTQDYYGAQPAGLSCPRAGAPDGGCANIPTVPLRVGPVQAVAQLDTGFDDSRQPYSVNINGALFDALQAAGVRLQPRPELALTLSTCVAGVSEAVQAYRLPRGSRVALVATDGQLLAPAGRAEPTLFVKRSPPAAAACGGIGTWAQPAAQLGASFVARGALVVDPFSARIWLR